MPKSGTAMSNASLPYLMGRNLGSIRGVLGSFRGVEVGEGIIVNHRGFFASRRGLKGFHSPFG